MVKQCFRPVVTRPQRRACSLVQGRISRGVPSTLQTEWRMKEPLSTQRLAPLKHQSRALAMKRRPLENHHCANSERQVYHLMYTPTDVPAVSPCLCRHYRPSLQSEPRLVFGHKNNEFVLQEHAKVEYTNPICASTTASATPTMSPAHRRLWNFSWPPQGATSLCYCGVCAMSTSGQ